MSRRHTIAVLAIVALAFLVAATVKRKAPDFSVLPVIAVVRDSAQRPLWAIRLARPAHEIAVDSLGSEPPPAGYAYRLWLATPTGARWLGLLPVSGRKVLAEIPARAARLAERGEVLVTLEPVRGADTAQPGGPVMFLAAFSQALSGPSSSRTGLRGHCESDTIMPLAGKPVCKLCVGRQSGGASLAGVPAGRTRSRGTGPAISMDAPVGIAVELLVAALVAAGTTARPGR